MYFGERLNAWTHRFGTLFATIAAIWLFATATSGGDVIKTISLVVYGITLVPL